MRQFWSEAAVIEENGRYLITIDGKPVKCSSGVPLAMPFEPLATAIAAEWVQAGALFSIDNLPLTRLAASAQEHIPIARDPIEGQLVSFGLNDLLCYRSPEPPALQAREAEVWQPWLDWAADELGIHLKITSGVMPVAQPAGCRDAFVRQIDTLNVYELAGLSVIVRALGSLVLGLAVQAGALSADAACLVASVEELWQEARWGLDTDAAGRRESSFIDVAAAARFMGLCKS
jgi:chaperone required for assembly of F1-ATPase